MREPYCPECDEELEHEDTFGNLDYCLDAIGYIGDRYTKRKPVKRGDIYFCKCCEEYYYTLDNDEELYCGYPC